MTKFRGWKEDRSFRWFTTGIIIGCLLVLALGCQAIERDIELPEPIYLDPPKDIFEDCRLLETTDAWHWCIEIERIA